MRPNIIDGRRTLIALGVAGVVLLIAGYSLYAALPLLLGPSITASTSLENGMVRIEGHTERVSFFTLDGGEVALDEKGGFSVERAYPSGYTVLTLRGQDRFGRSISKTITLTVP